MYLILRKGNNMLGQRPGEEFFYSTFVEDLHLVAQILSESKDARVYKLDTLTRVLDVLVTCEERVEEQHD